MKINTFIFKVASLCNLNCKYCYVYNKGDSSFKKQPKHMSAFTFELALNKIIAYAEENNISTVNINFHGGEPLLMGYDRAEKFLDILRKTFCNSRVNYSSTIQTNGLLLDEKFINLFIDKNIGIYISSDGTSEMNDRYRVDFSDIGIGMRLENKLDLISTTPLNKNFRGFLCVIDLQNDPEEIYFYFKRYNPFLVDFLLPLNNYKSPPAEEIKFYGEWLIKLFNVYMNDISNNFRIRYFDDIILKILKKSASDTKELLIPIIIETNGQIELDDTLKVANGAALNMNIQEESINSLLKNERFNLIEKEMTNLPNACQVCPVNDICHGGHISHRYSDNNNFDNPSIFCEALYMLIEHVSVYLEQVIAASVKSSSENLV